MNREELFALISELDSKAVVDEPEQPETSVDLWRQALSAIHLYQLTKTAEDSDLVYLRLYLEYMIWARTDNLDIWKQAEKDGLHCINSMDGHPLAKFYLLCLYFDRRMWNETLQLDFNQRDRDKIIDLGQDWRLSKIVEMKLGASLEADTACLHTLANQLLQSYLEAKDPQLLFPLTAGNMMDEWLAKHSSSSPSAPIEIVYVCKMIFECSKASRTVMHMRERFSNLSLVWQQLGLVA